MRKILQYAFLFLVLLTNSALSQSEELSMTAKYLESQVAEGNYKAISQAADLGDLTLIPYLKQLTRNVKARINPNSASFQAHIALAKLGNTEALREIINEVDDKDFAIQDVALTKLSLIGGKDAFKKLYELLDDTAPRQRESLCVIFFSRSVTAMGALQKMVTDPPTRKVGDIYVQVWKDWFEKNKHLID